MAQYQCDNCNELRTAAICPKCGADTHLVDVREPSLEELAAKVSRKAAVAETMPAPPSREPASTVPPPPRPRPSPPPAGPAPRVDAPRIEPRVAPPAVVPAPAETIVGLDAFHALLDRGSKAVIVCGDSNSGKSEIAYGYLRADSIYRGKGRDLVLRAALRTQDALGATNPTEIWYQPIDHRRAFLDPSGEFFRRLSPTHARMVQAEVTEANFLFVKRAVEHLGGIVLVVDLTSVADDRVQYPWRQQEEDLSFVLSALRWFRFDKEARPAALGVSANIAQRVSMFSRIDKRVLVLFSKADRLAKFTNQRPMDFARKRLPTLHAALMTHARRFRYDFCNTMIKTPTGGDQPVDPCGVLLPMNWLLDDKFRWLPFQMPTSWIGGGR